jgi:hypothetical protein
LVLSHAEALVMMAVFALGAFIIGGVSGYSSGVRDGEKKKLNARLESLCDHFGVPDEDEGEE